MNKESTKDTKNQYDKFIEAVKEHECDENEKIFDKKLKKIADNKDKGND